MKCTVKSLGVILDSHLNSDSHAKSVVAACSFHTHALRHIRNVLSEDVAKTIACSIVSVRLDYCNALLRGAPATTIDKLQRAQNTLARVVTQSTRQTPSRPLLQSLHWLPVRERIDYKVALLAYKVQTTSTPPYLVDSLLPCGRPMRRDLSSREHVLNSLALFFLFQPHPLGMASMTTFDSV